MAVEAEPHLFLKQYNNVIYLPYRKAVVRNSYFTEREIPTNLNSALVKIPKCDPVHWLRMWWSRGFTR